jgi:aminoglycoside phosphotransferase family enzyme
MLNFYKCYRAYVRGKIGLFTAGDPAVDEAVKESSIQAASKYFALAESYTR